MQVYSFVCQIKTMFTGLLVASAESLPLGILQIVYSQRITSRMAIMDVLSLVTSWTVHTPIYRHASILP